MTKNLENPNELQENSFNEELKWLEREVRTKRTNINDDRKRLERPSVPKDMRSVLEKYEGKTNLSDAEFKTYMGYINKYKTHSYLTNLTKITDYQATEFVKEATEISKEPYIDLRYLTSITDKQAEVLWKVKYLDLSWLKSITDKQAECLSKINTLFLNIWLFL